jgi:hypothetical protein
MTCDGTFLCAPGRAHLISWLKSNAHPATESVHVSLTASKVRIEVC